MKIKLQLILFCLLPLLTTSCNSKKLDGTYYYVETEEDNNIYAMGKVIHCTVIGMFEFKNEKCYINVMGVERRLNYEIEDNTIYFKESLASNVEVGIKIIDDNTIMYMGCLFKKDRSINNTEENTDKTSKSKSLSLDLSKDSYSKESAYIKDIKIIDEEIYVVIDVIQIKFSGNMGFDIINQNPKLRTYKLNSNTKIVDSKCNRLTSSEYLIENKSKLIENNDRHVSPFGFSLISTNNNGELTEINLGCWN